MSTRQQISKQNWIKLLKGLDKQASESKLDLTTTAVDDERYLGEIADVSVDMLGNPVKFYGTLSEGEKNFPTAMFKVRILESPRESKKGHNAIATKDKIKARGNLSADQIAITMINMLPDGYFVNNGTDEVPTVGERVSLVKDRKIDKLYRIYPFNEKQKQHVTLGVGLPGSLVLSETPPGGAAAFLNGPGNGAMVNASTEKFPIIPVTKFTNAIDSRMHPDFVKKLEEVIERIGAEGLPFTLAETYRSPARSDHIYYQWPEGSKAKAWESPHNFGIAADFHFIKNEFWSKRHTFYGPYGRWAKKGGLTAHELNLWRSLGRVVRETGGLEWGGNWRSFKDYPHIQLASWRTYKPSQRQRIETAYKERGQAVPETRAQNLAEWKVDSPKVNALKEKARLAEQERARLAGGQSEVDRDTGQSTEVQT